MTRFERSPEPAFRPPTVGEATVRRQLFLDDDPGRAAVFLAESPGAVWVQTAAECIARLEESWDEVHLDHDLGGEHYVDLSREDCGMEVVRWLCLHPHPHLKKTRFQIHSHNANAAAVMGMQMMMNGYTVMVRPFGSKEPLPWPERESPPRRTPLAALGDLLRRLLGRDDDGDPPAPGRPPLEPFDFERLTPSSAALDGGEGPGPASGPS